MSQKLGVSTASSNSRFPPGITKQDRNGELQMIVNLFYEIYRNSLLLFFDSSPTHPPAISFQPTNSEEPRPPAPFTIGNPNPNVCTVTLRLCQTNTEFLETKK